MTIDITRRIFTFFFARSPEAPSTREEGTLRCIDQRRHGKRYTPTIMVLFLRSSWEVSIEGMVPDIERSRGIVDEKEMGRWEKATRDPAVVSILVNWLSY
jgi:hypothetical protein